MVAERNKHVHTYNEEKSCQLLSDFRDFVYLEIEIVPVSV